jgi:hypothetical protein
MIKILAIGIILLFIGVGIQPLLAVETKSFFGKNKIIEDCDCIVVDKKNSPKLICIKILVKYGRWLWQYELLNSIYSFFMISGSPIAEMIKPFRDLADEKRDYFHDLYYEVYDCDYHIDFPLIY